MQKMMMDGSNLVEEDGKGFYEDMSVGWLYWDDVHPLSSISIYILLANYVISFQFGFEWREDKDRGFGSNYFKLNSNGDTIRIESWIRFKSILIAITIEIPYEVRLFVSGAHPYLNTSEPHNRCQHKCLSIQFLVL